jgi:hypothetical protein
LAIIPNSGREASGVRGEARGTGEVEETSHTTEGMHYA